MSNFKQDLIDDRYKDDFGRTLREQIIDYMETKSMGYEVLDYLESNGTLNDCVVYRGDSLYESVIKVGNTFKLWNGFASFTYDYQIAEKFSNIENVPDWYFDIKEWYANEEYPFAKYISNNENLVPVIIVIKEGLLPNCICTDEVTNKFDESEYLVYTENLEFIIEEIEDNKLYCSVRKVNNLDLWNRK